MEKRKIIFGDYDTAAHGWTLAAWQLSPAEQKTNFVDKPGGDGSWDLSTALTDGLPRYYDRELSATLELSTGDRLSRETIIREMVNSLDGMRVDITLPDDPDHYVTGRLHVAREYNDMAHAAVTVTATCNPWRYNVSPTEKTLTAETTEKTISLNNPGRLAVVPEITVIGSSANVTLKYGTYTVTLGAGSYILPDLLLLPGSHALTYSGTGTIKLSYRGAVLE